MSDYLQKSYDRAIRDLANAEARIKELEAVKEFSAAAVNALQADNLALCRQVTKLEAENQRLREAGAKIISAIRFGLSQDELEAMEEFEALLGGGECL